MNVSQISVYDNVSEKKRIASAHLATILYVLNAVKITGPVCYCPFCIGSFIDIASLQTHLHGKHLSFISELTTRTINFKECPFCCARFVGYHLLAKHALVCHGNVLVDAFFTKENGKSVCVFCHTHKDCKDMIGHLQEWHALQFDDWFVSNFPTRFEGASGLIDKAKEDSLHIDHLNVSLANLKVISPIQSILKTPSTSEKKKPRNLNVRRVLRFDDDNDKENRDLNTVYPKKTSGRRRSSDSSIPNNYLFKCGKCSISYTIHSQLVHHIKKEHRKQALISPLYQCAVCNAKFFKSSYLKVHGNLHTGPKNSPQPMLV